MSEKRNRDNIEKEITRHICNGQNTFEKLIQNLSGIYPSDLEEILSNMVNKEKIFLNKQGKYVLPTSHLFQKKNSLKKVDQDYSEFLKIIPNPHPLSFDWYFSLEGSRFICTKVLENHHVPDGSLLFLGSPLTAVYFLLAMDKLSINVSVSIIDINMDLLTLIKERFRKCSVIAHDLQNDLGDELKKQFEIIVIDPPWYIDYYRLFISRSAEFLKSDGWLYSSLFPFNTRPYAVQERMEVINLFILAGFSPWCIFPSVLEYETPPFEEKSLQTSGITLQQNWRHGDMIVLRSSGHLRPLFIGDYILEDPGWKEISFGKKRIKIRINPAVNTYIKPEIVPLCNESIIFPTVSRRHPHRKFIDMWTSDNEAFVVCGHNVIYDILLSIQKDSNIEHILLELSQKYGKNLHEIRDEIASIYNILKDIVMT